MADFMTRLAEDRALVERIGEQARVFATGFSWDGAADHTERHLTEVVRG
jgi:hypothetical protein